MILELSLAAGYAASLLIAGARKGTPKSKPEQEVKLSFQAPIEEQILPAPAEPEPVFVAPPPVDLDLIKPEPVFVAPPPPLPPPITILPDPPKQVPVMAPAASVFSTFVRPVVYVPPSPPPEEVVPYVPYIAPPIQEDFMRFNSPIEIAPVYADAVFRPRGEFIEGMPKQKRNAKTKNHIVMRLELLGALPTSPIEINLPRFKRVSVAPPISPLIKTSFIDKLTTGITQVTNVANTVKDTVNTVKQVFNPSGGSQPQQQQYINQNKIGSKDNSALYIGLGVGGALLLTGVAVAVSRKKKRRGMGRVRRKSRARRR